MFGKLKDKLKGVFQNFSKKVDEEAEDIIEETEDKKTDVEQVKEKKEEPKKEKPVKEIKKEKIKSKPSQKEKLPEEEKIELEDKKSHDSEVQQLEQEIEDLQEEKELEKKKEDLKEEIISEEQKDLQETEIEEKEEELNKEIIETEKKIEEEIPEKKGFMSKFFGKKKKETENLEEDSYKEKIEEKEVVDESVKEADSQKTEIKEQDSQGLFGKISDSFTKKKLSVEKFEDLFEDIEIALLENNVSFEVVEKIKEDLKKDLTEKILPKKNLDELILNSLKESISSLFDVPFIDIFEEAEKKSPCIISLIGVNGSGKTTQLAKIAKKIQDQGKTCVVAACDTFRSAAIQQLEEHANNLGLKLIKHDYGADAAAVAYDAIEHAKAKHLDFVLIDTAGRLHSNVNLMKELEKLMKVAQPDLNLFVGESITGNDCVEQATQFGEAVRIDGIILTKADVDEKGGAALSISYVTKKPILYIGMGQEYDDLKQFDKEIILKNLGL